MSQVFNASSIQVVPDVRMPQNRMRLSHGNKVLRKTLVKYNPLNGALFQQYSSNNEVVMQIGSSSRNAFLSPSESFFTVQLQLKKADGSNVTAANLASTPVAYHGSHTLIKTFTVAHLLTQTVIEQVVDHADIVAQTSLGWAPASSFDVACHSIGSTMQRLEMEPSGSVVTALTGAAATAYGALMPVQIAPKMNGKNNKVRSNPTIRYNWDDLAQTNNLLANQASQVLMLPSDFLNQEGMLSLYWCPIELRLLLNAPEVFLTQLGGTYTAVGTIATDTWADPAKLITDYSIKVVFNACVYSLDEGSVSQVESLIMSSGLKIDFERCAVTSYTIQPSETERTLSINAPRINSLNRLLVTFVPQSAINAFLEDKYLFGACEKALTNAAGTLHTDLRAYNGLSQWQVAIGDQVYPLQAVDVAPYQFLQSYLVTKEIISDGATSIGLISDSHSKHLYEGISMLNRYDVAQTGQFCGRLENFFCVGYDFRKSSSLMQGASLAVSPLNLTLRFFSSGGSMDEAHIAVVMLFHSAELSISESTVVVST